MITEPDEVRAPRYKLLQYGGVIDLETGDQITPNDAAEWALYIASIAGGLAAAAVDDHDVVPDPLVRD